MSDDRTLMRTEKNAVLELIIQFGLDPVMFDWSEEEQKETIRRPAFLGHYRVSVLTHRSSGYYINFGGIYVRCSSGMSGKVESQLHNNAWASKLGVCQFWLARLKNELDAPDLWVSLAQEPALPKAVSSASLDNRLFTPAERSLISTRLDEIKAYLLEGQQFAAEQAETIEREFAHLRESSERLGRKDWLNNLLGGIVGLAIGLALDPAKSRGILRFAGDVFQSLWGTAAGLLQ